MQQQPYTPALPAYNPMQIAQPALAPPISGLAALRGFDTGFMPLDPTVESLRDMSRKRIGLEGYPQFERYANTGGRIEEAAAPERNQDTIPAMLTEEENVITRPGVLGLDLMLGGTGDFTRGHEMINNITRQGEDYLDEVLNRPLFNGGR